MSNSNSEPTNQSISEVGWLTDSAGHKSSMRLMGVIALIASIALALPQDFLLTRFHRI